MISRPSTLATTSRDLRVEVNAGRFHPELYRRLAATHFYLPPLRERDDDVNLLTARFLAAFEAGAHGERLRSPEQQVEIARRSYPANVRDLARHVARAVVFARHAGERETVGSGETLADARARWEREFDAHVDRLLQAVSSRNLR